MGRHHAQLALVNESGEVVDLLFQCRLLLVLLGVGVCGLGAGVCVAEVRHVGGFGSRMKD